MKISDQVRDELGQDIEESSGEGSLWTTVNFGRLCIEDPVLAGMIMAFGPIGIMTGVVVWEAMQRQARLDELAGKERKA